MQTFLPYRDFVDSASVLDDKRLGKQRVECLQILRALHDPGYGWQNHPAVLMWKGYESMLLRYAFAICVEWRHHRGFNDTCWAKCVEFDNPLRPLFIPPWLGDEDFHASHRANLLRKDPGHYLQFGWTEDPTMPYYWPTKQNTER